MPWKDETGGWCSGSIQIPNPNPGRVPRFNGDEWEDAPPATLANDLANLLQARHPNLDALSALSQVGVLHRDAEGQLGVATLGSLFSAQNLLDMIKTVDGANSGLDADLFRGQVAQVRSDQLDALAELSGTGVVQRTGPNTFSVGGGVDAATLGGVAPAGYQAADADLTGLAGLGGTGFVVRTGEGTFANRTINGTSGQIAVDPANGAAGNPTISIASDAAIPGTGGMKLPSGTTAQRPGSPAVGTTRYNTTDGAVEVFGPTSWGKISPAYGTWRTGNATNGDVSTPVSLFKDSNFADSDPAYVTHSDGVSLNPANGAFGVGEGMYLILVNVQLSSSKPTVDHEVQIRDVTSTPLVLCSRAFPHQANTQCLSVVASFAANSKLDVYVTAPNNFKFAAGTNVAIVRIG